MAVTPSDPILALIAEAKKNGTNLSFNRDTRKLKWSGTPPTDTLRAKLRANKDALITHLVREPERAAVVGMPSLVGSYYGIPGGKSITGAELAMAIPQLISPELPEMRGAAKLLGPEALQFAEESPKKAQALYHLGRAGLASAAGAALGGKKGALVGGLSEAAGWPLELLGPAKRLFGRVPNMARTIASQTGDVMADMFQDSLPETTNKIRAGAAKFARGVAGDNWAHIITRPAASSEMQKFYDDGIATIIKDMRDSINGKARGEINALTRNGVPATPEQLLQIQAIQDRAKKEIADSTAEFNRLKTAKIEAGNAAFKPTGEVRATTTKGQRMAEYSQAKAALSGFMDQHDMTYGSQMRPNLEKLNNTYDSFLDANEMAKTPNLRHPKTGGINHQVLQEHLLHPDSAFAEKSFGQKNFAKLAKAAGLAEDNSSSSTEGALPVRFRASAANPASGYFGIPKLPYDPVKNIPGLLGPTRAGGRAGAVVKALTKGVVAPTLIQKFIEEGDQPSY